MFGDDALLPPEFSVIVESAGTRSVVRIIGELDMATLPRVEHATRDLVAAGSSVLFDLSGLTFVDSSGLRYFVGLHRAAQLDGFSFALTRPRVRVFRAFELTALDAVLPFAEDDDAV